MKKIYIPYFSIVIACSLTLFSLKSNAGFVTVPCTGFTADVVANGVGSPVASTDSTFDNAGFYLLDSTYRYTVGGVAPAHALSPSGLIHSVATAGLDFQLASFSTANSLRIAALNSAKTLTFVTPVSASQVYILGATGSGQGTMTVTVNFTDATSQTFSSQILPDWFAGTGFAIQGIGRVNALNSQPTGTTAPTDPRLYQKAFTLNAANYTKLISGITLTQTSVTVAVINIMAVSIATPPLSTTFIENASSASIKIFPNPVVAEFTAEINGLRNFSGEKVSYKIYNLIGAQIYATSTLCKEENKIEIKPEAKLAAGIYVLEMEVNHQKILQKFAVK